MRVKRDQGLGGRRNPSTSKRRGGVLARGLNAMRLDQGGDRLAQPNPRGSRTGEPLRFHAGFARRDGRRLGWVLGVVLWLYQPATVNGQPPEGEGNELQQVTETLAEREKRLEAIRKRIEDRDPLEFIRSRIYPSEVIPYIKPGHWGWLSLELRSNPQDYEGVVESDPVALEGLGQAVVHRRDVALRRLELSQNGLPLFVPDNRLKELGFRLRRADQTRPDLEFSASLTRLEAHQSLIVVLTERPGNYSRWNSLKAMSPIQITSSDIARLDQQRYYRLAMGREVERIANVTTVRTLLPPHPLTWTMTSHLIWDGVASHELNPAQQRALIDWLHWGGQLVIIAPGGGASITALRDGFLAPYLPALPTGSNLELTPEELKALADHYRPPRLLDIGTADRFNPGVVVTVPSAADQELATLMETAAAKLDQEEGDEVSFDFRDFGTQIDQALEKNAVDPGVPRYYKPVELKGLRNRPIYLAGLQPRPSASVIPIAPGLSPARPLAVEWRVGRGRVTILAIDPNAGVWIRWPGTDTLIRRVVLRRPEDPAFVQGNGRTRYGLLNGTDLSWVRYAARDLAGSVAIGSDAANLGRDTGTFSNTTPSRFVMGTFAGSQPDFEFDTIPSNPAGAVWSDEALVPRIARDLLIEASGITIPRSSFVLGVVAVFLVVLVPLNYAVCRFVLGRRELAWVGVPLLAIGFAIGIERAAAFDLGFSLANDEIALVELQGGYERAHLSRFGSVLSNGRASFDFAHPDHDRQAIVLPLNIGQGVRGQVRDQIVFQSEPVPSLLGLKVAPRSLSTYRAEEMINLGGSIRLERTTNPPSQPTSLDGDAALLVVVNETELTLRDVRISDFQRQLVARVDRLEPGGRLGLAQLEWQPLNPAASHAGSDTDNPTTTNPEAQPPPSTPTPTPTDSQEIKGLRIEPLLDQFTRVAPNEWEARGELRLTARVDWPDGIVPGELIEPEVQRRRAVCGVLAHLAYPTSIDPGSFPYNEFAP